MIEPKDLTAVVLCGGRGSRLHNQDKPLLKLANKYIIEWIIERLQNQVNEILISGSRNIAIYESLGYHVVVDSELEKGPLVGITSAFPLIETEWSLVIPGDTPFIARNLVSLLATTAKVEGVAVPKIDGFSQNLCLLLNQVRRTELQDFYQNGGSAVKYWLDKFPNCAVDLTSIASTFFNINTPTDLDKAQSLAGAESQE